MAVVSLTTVGNVENSIGRTLSASETTRATYYISAISAFIASYCDLIDFTEVGDDVLRTQADYYGIIELGGGPISSVTSVKDVDGTEVQEWTFDGSRMIVGFEPFLTVDVTYSHGTDIIPDDLVYIATEAVVGAASLNTDLPLKVRTVGDVTYAYATDSGIVVDLPRHVLDRYATTAYTMRLGPHSARELDYRPLNWFQIGG